MYKRDPKKHRETNKKSYRKNRKKVLAQHKKYREENKERLRELNKGYKKKYRAKPGIKEKEAEASRKYYLIRAPEAKKYSKEWKLLNPFKVKAQKHKRRCLEIGIESKTIQKVYEDNIKKYGTLTCYLCLKSIEFGSDTLEHKTPLSRGGTNEYSNLAIACRSCNCKKNTKTEGEYKKRKDK